MRKIILASALLFASGPSFADTICLADWGGTVCFWDGSGGGGGNNGGTGGGGNDGSAAAAPQPSDFTACTDAQDGDGPETDCQ